MYAGHPLGLSRYPWGSGIAALMGNESLATVRRFDIELTVHQSESEDSRAMEGLSANLFGETVPSRYTSSGTASSLGHCFGCILCCMFGHTGHRTVCMCQPVDA